VTPVLVDTSVWRGYLSGRPSTRALGDLLDEDGLVWMHPWVLGELMLGASLRERNNCFAVCRARP
jgi:predicted nucleic acid-binding protein